MKKGGGRVNRRKKVKGDGEKGKNIVLKNDSD